MKKIVLLIETSREFGRQLIIGVARYSRINGPWSFYKEQIGLKSSIPHLTSWKPDGIIMRSSMIKKELLKMKIPTILALHDASSPRFMPVIKTDSYSISKMASEHLLEKGFRNFAFCGFDNYEWSNNRKLYFEQFINDAGFKASCYKSTIKNKNHDWRSEQLHVSNWIKTLPKPVGIMACNDDRSQHILEVCKLLGLQVPEDVAVIGVDNDPMICEIGYPPLTSVALNVEAAGYETARLLDELLNGSKMCGQQIIVTPSQVVQRQSTDILAINDVDVSAAIKFIRDNAKNKILVNDIVNITNIGRRTLEQKFKKTIHRSIYNEIRRVRVEWISKMLIDTDMPISEITSQLSFTDFEHISRYFKKEKGIGLSKFRKLHQSH